MLSVGWVLSTVIVICVALLILAGLFLAFTRNGRKSAQCFGIAGGLSVLCGVFYLLMHEYVLLLLSWGIAAMLLIATPEVERRINGRNQSKLKNTNGR